MLLWGGVGWGGVELGGLKDTKLTNFGLQHILYTTNTHQAYNI